MWHSEDIAPRQIQASIFRAHSNPNLDSTTQSHPRGLEALDGCTVPDAAPVRAHLQVQPNQIRVRRVSYKPCRLVAPVRNDAEAEPFRARGNIVRNIVSGRPNFVRGGLVHVVSCFEEFRGAQSEVVGDRVLDARQEDDARAVVVVIRHVVADVQTCAEREPR